MKQRLIILLACSTLMLAGCGSFLATMQVDTIEDEPVERTMGQMIEDDKAGFGVDGWADVQVVTCLSGGGKGEWAVVQPGGAPVAWAPTLRKKSQNLPLAGTSNN